MKKLIKYENQAGEVVEDWVEQGDGMHERETLPGQTSFISLGRTTEASEAVVEKPKQPGLFD